MFFSWNLVVVEMRPLIPGAPSCIYGDHMSSCPRQRKSQNRIGSPAIASYLQSDTKSIIQYLAYTTMLWVNMGRIPILPFSPPPLPCLKTPPACWGTFQESGDAQTAIDRHSQVIELANCAHRSLGPAVKCRDRLCVSRISTCSILCHLVVSWFALQVFVWVLRCWRRKIRHSRRTIFLWGWHSEMRTVSARARKFSS